MRGGNRESGAEDAPRRTLTLGIRDAAEGTRWDQSRTALVWDLGDKPLYPHEVE